MITDLPNLSLRRPARGLDFTHCACTAFPRCRGRRALQYFPARGAKNELPTAKEKSVICLGDTINFSALCNFISKPPYRFLPLLFHHGTMDIL